MSAALLTQEEIEALLELVHSGDLAAAGEADGEVEKRDFSRPSALPRAELERLRAEAVAGSTRITEIVSQWLRLDARVECLGLEPMHFSAIASGFAPHTLVYPIRCGAGGAQTGALAVDPALALAAVDRVLGGSGRAKFATRALSSVEKGIAERLATTLLKGLVEGIGEAIPLDPAPAGAPLAPRKIPALLEPATAMLVASYTIGGDLAETEWRLAVPVVALPAASAPPQAAPERLPDPLHGVTVGVAVRLGSSTLPLRELLALEPGDVVTLHERSSAPASLEVEGRPIAACRVGTQQNHLAVAVESILRPAPREEHRP